MKLINKVCPVCGNDISVNPYVKMFRCHYCKRPVKINLIWKKGKRYVQLYAWEEDKNT